MLKKQQEFMKSEISLVVWNISKYSIYRSNVPLKEIHHLYFEDVSIDNILQLIELISL